MNNGLSLEVVSYIALTGLFCFVFFYSRDMLQKQLALFTASYFIFVYFSNALFGRDFSSKTFIGNFGIDVISVAMFAFWFSFYFASNANKVRANRGPVALRLPGGRGTAVDTWILTIPIIAFFAYYLAQNGVRLTGSFVDYRGQRSTLTDYIFVYYIALLAYYRNSRLMLALGLIAAASHLLSAERLRSFVYILAILLNFYRLDTRRHISSLFLLFGFVVATLVGQLRTGSLVGNQDYNITHFGSVTVSSMYLLDFSSTLNAGQKMMFSFGTFIANLVPSSIVSESYNIRRAILTYATIPGGGWLPIFIYVQGGFFAVITLGVALGRTYHRVRLRVQRPSMMQPAFYAAVLTFIATAPRWYMYTPFQLLKMPLYAFTLTAILIMLQTMTSGRRIPNAT